MRQSLTNSEISWTENGIIERMRKASIQKIFIENLEIGKLLSFDLIIFSHPYINRGERFNLFTLNHLLCGKQYLLFYVYAVELIKKILQSITFRRKAHIVRFFSSFSNKDFPTKMIFLNTVPILDRIIKYDKAFIDVILFQELQKLNFCHGCLLLSRRCWSA